MSLVLVQSDSPEYRAACKLWDLYLRTKNEFVQRGDYEDDDEDGFDVQDNPGGSTEDEVKVNVLTLILETSPVVYLYVQGNARTIAFLCLLTN